MDRRTLLKTIPAALLAPGHAFPAPGPAAQPGKFPALFLWGAATAGYQVEGNNVNADIWLLEHVRPTIFTEPSGDACDSFARWPEDLRLVRSLGLNAYRFSLEWARIEPVQGHFSPAMLDHYKRLIDACRACGIVPVVTFNHFACPIWFAARGGWTAEDAPGLYARYCERAARHLGAGIGVALTLNEPNIMKVLRWFSPSPEFVATRRAMLDAAARATGSRRFVTGLVANDEDVDAMLAPMIAAHRLSHEAIKSVQPGLPVGASISVSDDQPVGGTTPVDQKRKEVYGAWLEALRETGDFIGVQNYDRMRIDANGVAPPPEGARLTHHGVEIYPDSLGNAVRYVHQATGKPVIVTENGLDTQDDALRAAYIPAALAGLHKAVVDGIPILGYIYWSLLDNYEWSLGYAYRYGLFSVDRKAFKRIRKPSASVLSRIAMRNALPALSSTTR
ncbi:glycoside hydrolase family 1 protein [Noviherbaspirillum suwonense]|uniref:Aryl-beta-glucosidase n=1 Tax=Noviherbaspirillum suwonense TaxID=1224511 RepID=A0ABY1QTQ7_9BURK|nr:family 1 glycosylhydrolase [Noviherbaspirillum suwonense]SMP79726.1 aryl-beta-glucosidase [Noviherbaspirillum suwonense]